MSSPSDSSQTPSSIQKSQERSSSTLLGALLLIHTCLAGFLTLRYSPTLDEVAQLPAGLAVWKFGSTDLYRVNPPLVRSLAALPILFLPHHEDWSHYVPGSPHRCEWDVGADFILANREHVFWLYSVSRWPCLLFSILGLILCWNWGRELCGPRGAAVAASLWCFSPSLIGHAALITNDVAATSLGLLATWRFHRWLKCPDWKQTFLSGVCLGLALLAKTYWIILLGLWPMITLIHSLSSNPRTASALQAEATSIRIPQGWVMLKLGLILCLGIHVLNMGYGFAGTGTRLGSYPFYSRTLSGEHRNLQIDPPANLFENHWLGKIPLPLPSDYVTGIDLQKHDLERPHTNYLLGELRRPGWWYYYLVGLAVKVPLGTWGLVLAGAFAWLQQPDARARLRDLLPLWLPAITVFVLVSCETGMNRHVRYVFPVLPVLYIVAAQAALLTKWRRIVQCLLILTVAESLSSFPGSLSHFNSISGIVGQGKPVLIDSNLDWGQDLGLALKWIENHPECRPVTLSPVCGFPQYLAAEGFAVTPVGQPPPGWHLISIHQLMATGNSYSGFQNLQPVGRVGSTLNIYHVPE